MIVDRIRLKRFKKFRDKTLDFAPGLNIIKGPNEAGKSTLHEALRTVLFEKPTTTSQPMKAARSWGSEEMFAVGIRFSVDGAAYELDKDFSAKKAVLSGPDLREPICDPDEIHGRLQAWLGCPSERFFTSTTCVAQDELAIPDRGKAEVAGRLQSVIAGGGTDVAARDALKSVSKALGELTRGLDSPAKNPGRILAARDRLTELRALSDEMLASVREVEEARRERAELEANLAECREDMQVKEEVVAKNDKIRSLRLELDGLEKEYGRRRHAKELRDKVAVLVEQENTFARLAGVERRVEELEKASMLLGARRGDLERVRGAEASAPEAPRPSWSIAVLGALLGAVGAVGAFTVSLGMLLVSIAGMGLLIFGLAKALAARRGTGQPRSSQTAVLQAQIDSDENEMASGLAELGYDSIEQVLKDKAAFHQARDNRKQKEGELRGATGGKSWEEFESATRGIAQEVERKQEVLEGLAPSELDPVELEKLRAEVERLRRSAGDLGDRLARAGYVLEHANVDADELAGVQDEMADLTETAGILEHRRKVYEATIEGIREAERETMATATSALKETIGKRVARITGDKYSEVQVDENDLSMRVRSGEKGDWASVEDELSRATKDQFYLSARLGLIDHLCAGAKPPLLLDDPFVTFDADRLERTIQLLQEAAKERQVLLFTCHDEYDRFIDEQTGKDRIVDLGAGEDAR